MSSNILNEYNKAKLNLINKYVKYSKNLARARTNPDTFISINEFLSDKPSHGPNASKGDINYFYMDYENINNFIKILMNDIEFDKILCLSEMTIKYKKYINRNSFGYNFDKDYIIIPVDAIDEIQNCKNKRFVYINFIIFWEKFDYGHANMLLIDNYNKTIERFEPYGKSIGKNSKSNLSQKIDKKFNKNLLNKLKLNGYKYISPIKLSPNIGIQSKADAYDGMCVTYCLIYLQLRLMNPDIDQKIVIKYLLSKTRNEIIGIILKYARYIEESLKDNSYRIIREMRKLYYDDYNMVKDYLIITNNDQKYVSY